MTLRNSLIEVALALAIAVPIIAAAQSSLLQWRDPIYIIAGFSGVLALALLLVPPLMIVEALPGAPGRRIHVWTGVDLVLTVAVHVAGLWILSPPDMVDVLLFRSPTPFAVWGVVAMIEIAATAALCNDAALHDDPDGWRVEGDPMEGALQALAGKIMRNEADPFAAWTRTDSIPFDASRREMAVLHQNHDGRAMIHVKGAPERIIAMCATQRTAEGGTAPVDAGYWHRHLDDLAALGQRVLAQALRSVPGEQRGLNAPDLEGQLVLISIIGLFDPPRAESIAAVADCQGAGIRVKMITGDHPGTVAAIGRQIGLANPDRVLTGAELETMSDGELAAVVLNTDIFARTTRRLWSLAGI